MIAIDCSAALAVLAVGPKVKPTDHLYHRVDAQERSHRPGKARVVQSKMSKGANGRPITRPSKIQHGDERQGHHRYDEQSSPEASIPLTAFIPDASSEKSIGSVGSRFTLESSNLKGSFQFANDSNGDY